MFMEPFIFFFVIPFYYFGTAFLLLFIPILFILFLVTVHLTRRNEKLLDEGKKLFEEGRFEEVIRISNNVLKDTCDNLEAFILRGRALSELGYFEKSLKSFDEALRFKSDFYQTWNARGDVLMLMDRLDEAIQSYDRTLQIKPGYPPALDNREKALKRLGGSKERMTAFKFHQAKA
jgi:tetratricopeptide (TPR) repeat protein